MPQRFQWGTRSPSEGLAAAAHSQLLRDGQCRGRRRVRGSAWQGCSFAWQAAAGVHCMYIDDMALLRGSFGRFARERVPHRSASARGCSCRTCLQLREALTGGRGHWGQGALAAQGDNGRATRALRAIRVRARSHSHLLLPCVPGAHSACSLPDARRRWRAERGGTATPPVAWQPPPRAQTRSAWGQRRRTRMSKRVGGGGEAQTCAGARRARAHAPMHPPSTAPQPVPLLARASRSGVVALLRHRQGRGAAGGPLLQRPPN